MTTKTGLAAALAAGLGAAIGATAAGAVPVSWIEWDGDSQLCGAAGCTVEGTLGSGADAVGVTYSTTNTGFVYLLAGGASDTDFWINNGSGGSPYESEGPKGNDNRPTDTDMIGLFQAGTHTFTFSKAVTDIYFAFISLNSNALTFSTGVEVLSSAGEDLDGAGTDSCGYWGCGTAGVTGGNVLSGAGEPHGVALLEGSFTSFSFTNGAENWHGFTIGAAGLGGEDPGPAPIPVPAGAPLLLSALGALAALRRGRRGA